MAKDNSAAIDTDWISWDKMRAYMTGTGLFGVVEWPTIVTAWAANGDLETRAQQMVWNGITKRNEIIPAAVWKLAQNGKGTANLGSGRLRCKGIISHNLDEAEIEAYGIEVRQSQLERIAPLPEDAEANFAPLLAMIGAKAGTKPKGNGGAKSDRAAWDAFWMAVVELAVQERLTPAFFETQKELSAEILEMINDAMKERTIKSHVSMIWNKWVQPTR